MKTYFRESVARKQIIAVRRTKGRLAGESRLSEAVRELESTGQKSTGICTGCTAADRHSTAELEVNLKHVI